MMTASRLRNSWTSSLAVSRASVGSCELMHPPRVWALPGHRPRPVTEHRAMQKGGATQGRPAPPASCRSQALHQSPFVEIAVTFVAQLIQDLSRDGKAAAALACRVGHGTGQLIVKSRTAMRERRH